MKFIIIEMLFMLFWNAFSSNIDERECSPEVCPLYLSPRCLKAGVPAYDCICWFYAQHDLVNPRQCGTTSIDMTFRLLSC